MTWIPLGLGMVLLVVVAATVLRTTPSDGRPAGGTKLLGVARVVLVLLAVTLILSAML